MSDVLEGTTLAESFEREHVVTALCGRMTCPEYLLPCWVCDVLHVLTGTIRSVTAGRFERFERDGAVTSMSLGSENRRFNWAETDASLIEPEQNWTRWPDLIAPCCDHPEYALERTPGYWNSGEASAVQSVYQYELPLA